MDHEHLADSDCHDVIAAIYTISFYFMRRRPFLSITTKVGSDGSMVMNLEAWQFRASVAADQSMLGEAWPT